MQSHSHTRTHTNTVSDTCTLIATHTLPVLYTHRLTKSPSHTHTLLTKFYTHMVLYKNPLLCTHAQNLANTHITHNFVPRNTQTLSQTPVTSGISFVTAHVAYASRNKNQNCLNQGGSLLFSPRADMPCAYLCLDTMLLPVLLVPKPLRRVLTALVGTAAWR